jgi:hypothetical protein
MDPKWTKLDKMGVYHGIANEVKASLSLKWLLISNYKTTLLRDLKENGLGSLRAPYGIRPQKPEIWKIRTYVTGKM